MSGIELYVYYRVPVAAEPAAAEQIRARQRELCADLPGLQARLLRRGADVAALATEGPATWMEIYRHPDGLSGEPLERIRLAMTDLPAQRSGERHEETFEPLEDAGDPAGAAMPSIAG